MKYEVSKNQIIQVVNGFQTENHDPLVDTEFMQLIQDNPKNRMP